MKEVRNKKVAERQLWSCEHVCVCNKLCYTFNRGVWALNMKCLRLVKVRLSFHLTCMDCVL